MTILPFDEINALKGRLTVYFGEDGRVREKKYLNDIIDELWDLFMLAYLNGFNATIGEMGKDAEPSTGAMYNAIFFPVAGETWRDRVKNYVENGGTLYDIIRIAETDATRIYNQGALDAAKAIDAEDTAYKRWCTMLDDRVRDTHDYLEGMVVPVNDDFYTFDGDHAPAPGMFSLPENNINCRCVIEVIPAEQAALQHREVL